MQPNLSRIVVAASLLTLLCLPVAAQAATLSVDLGTLDPGKTHQFSVSPGEYTVELRNRVIDTAYEVSVEQQVIPIPQLTLPPLPASLVSDCQTIDSLTRAIRAATTEKEVRQNVVSLQAALANPSCTDETIRQNARRAILATIQPVAGSWTLVRGEQLKVTVSRVIGKETKTWTVVYSTGARGEWQTSYGFSFVPDGDDEFFVNAEDDTFTITEKSGREDYDFVPGVFFTWMPRRSLLGNVHIGPTAGLGFDLDRPVVFGGLAISWTQNVSLVLGGVMHEERRLAGQYSEGDELAENLESDQLHDTTYAPAGFFGISFRFGSNPFGSNDDGGDDSD